MDDGRSILRHLIATLHYRMSVALHQVPESFAFVEVGHGVRTPIEIVEHMTGLVGMALRIYGKTVEKAPESQGWDGAIQRFDEQLKELDACIADGGTPLTASMEQLIQGPVCDAFTHIGQLLLIRRFAGYPSEGGNYWRAEIHSGQWK